ncbi:MAG: spermidine synthase [Geodermatophilaceae bacterium]|nr:spermidine synthase [Geodermatophilaceae bacterium]
MDTRAGSSERLLVSAALDSRALPAHVLIGGLGVGFSLAEALVHPLTLDVTVVEVEPAVIDWQRTHLAAFSGHALDDPRVRVVCADLLDWLDVKDGRYDVICVDIDNGPQWTVTDRNAGLYCDTGLARVKKRLAVDGTVAVWSAADDDAFYRRLDAVFGNARCHFLPVRRGEPDVVFVAGR